MFTTVTTMIAGLFALVGIVGAFLVRFASKSASRKARMDATDKEIEKARKSNEVLQQSTPSGRGLLSRIRKRSGL